MTDFGLLPSGFVPKRLADCLSDTIALFQQKLTANIDLSADQPPMQIIGILADIQAAFWELLDQIYQAGFEAGASGVPLDQLFALINIQRLPAKSTRVVVTCVSTSGSTLPISLPAGQVLATSDAGTLFSSIADATLPPAGGSVDVTFDAQDTGAVPALAGTLSVIKTTVAGWASASNALDGVVGRDIETDLAMKTRRTEALVSIIASSSPAVVAAVLRLANVVEVREIENASAYADADGRPPNSYELVVREGDDNAIRTAMFLTKPAGIQTVGNVSGTVADLRGDLQPINFSRPTQVPVYIDVTLTTNGNFPSNGVALVRAAILAFGQDQLTIGQTVSPFQIEQTIETAGIITFDMRLGRVATPADADPLLMSRTELAVFDSTRLNVRIA